MGLVAVRGIHGNLIVLQGKRTRETQRHRAPFPRTAPNANRLLFGIEWCLEEFRCQHR